MLYLSLWLELLYNHHGQSPSSSSAKRTFKSLVLAEGTIIIILAKIASEEVISVFTKKMFLEIKTIENHNLHSQISIESRIEASQKEIQIALQKLEKAVEVTRESNIELFTY